MSESTEARNLHPGWQASKKTGPDRHGLHTVTEGEERAAATQSDWSKIEKDPAQMAFFRELVDLPPEERREVIEERTTAGTLSPEMHRQLVRIDYIEDADMTADAVMEGDTKTIGERHPYIAIDTDKRLNAFFKELVAMDEDRRSLFLESLAELSEFNIVPQAILDQAKILGWIGQQKTLSFAAEQAASAPEAPDLNLSPAIAREPRFKKLFSHLALLDEGSRRPLVSKLLMLFGYDLLPRTVYDQINDLGWVS